MRLYKANIGYYVCPVANDDWRHWFVDRWMDQVRMDYLADRLGKIGFVALGQGQAFKVYVPHTPLLEPPQMMYDTGGNLALYYPNSSAPYEQVNLYQFEMFVESFPV